VPTSDDVIYLESSALIKLVVNEPESVALGAFLAARTLLVSSALARVEVIRNVLRHGDVATQRARRVLAAVRLLSIDERLLEQAATLDPHALRTLDAIHLATAQTVLTSQGDLVTYDHRMRAAAERLRFKVVAPGEIP